MAQSHTCPWGSVLGVFFSVEECFPVEGTDAQLQAVGWSGTRA